MATLKEWWEGFWGTVKSSPTILPARYAIPAEHTGKPAQERFKRDQHYFTVTVNRIFLKYSREFWTTYAPMALAVSEFSYDGNDTVVPFVVGPQMLEKNKIDLPAGFVFADTKVAGINAYKGDGLKLTVILYRVKRTDLAGKLLKVVENLASVLDFSQALSSYLKIAHVLVDTVGEVIGSDKDNQPIIGLRKEFSESDDFKPGYFALIESGKTPVPQDQLWVRDNELVFGKDRDSAQDFSGANFVLYSINQTTWRDDYDQFPFYTQWRTALAESFTSDPEKWKSACANWTTLYQMMALSPDLLPGQADQLADRCYAQMNEKHERVKSAAGRMGPATAAVVPGQDKDLSALSARLDLIRAKSVSVL
jgi:hypothetical protein